MRGSASDVAKHVAFHMTNHVIYRVKYHVIGVDGGSAASNTANHMMGNVTT